MKTRTPLHSIPALALLLGLTFASTAWATDYVSAATGNWNITTNWTPNGNPGASDTARIQSGHIITNTANTTLAATTIDSGGTFVLGASATLKSLLNNGTLTVGNNTSARTLTLARGFTNNGTFNTPSTTPTHTLTFSANANWTGSGDISGVKCSLTVNTGTTLDASGLTTPLKVKSSGTLAITISGALIAGAQVINGNGNGSATISVGAAGRLITANPNGIINGTTGMLNFASTPSFNASSSFGFNGTAAQVTTGMPAAVGDLTISNVTGVTLSAATSIGGTLGLDAGILNTTAGTLPTLASSGAVTGVGYVNGPLAQTFSATGARTFLTGKGGNSRPVTLNYSALTGSSTVTVEQFETPLGGTLPTATTLFTNRHWTVSQSGGSGFTFDLSLDGTGFSPAATPVILRLGSPDSSFSASVATPNYTATGLSAFGDFGLGDFAPSPDKLTFTTTPQTLTAGDLSATITVQLQDSGGTPKNAASDLVVTLNTTSSGGVFRNLADTATITSVTIPALNNSVSFKYRDIVAPGTPALTASGGGVNPGDQNETINTAPASKLAFTSQPADGFLANTLPAFVVQVQDAFGNNLPNAGTNLTLTLNGGVLASGTTAQTTDGSGAVIWNDFVINDPGAGLNYTAAAPGLSSAVSSNFNVTSKLIQKAQNTTAMNLPGSWVGAVVPTSFDTALINNASVGTSQNNAEFGPSSTWFGLQVSSWTAGTGYTINGNQGGTLALGPGGIVGASINHTLTFNCALALATNQVWDWSGGSGVLTVNNTLDNAGYQLTLGGNQNISISGDISGAGGLIKQGTGTLTLTNSHDYTGVTTVSNGVLLVGGTLNGGGAVNVAGGTLEGVGTIGGPVSIHSGGTLAPGVSGIGTLTLTSNLTLQAGSQTRVEVNKNTSASDLITGLNQAAYGGTLIVTNLAGTLGAGDFFTLFSAASHSGNFSGISGSPGTNLGWNFNPTNGMLRVVNLIANYPTNITATVSGATLTLSWPATHLGWILQSQTNAVNVGLRTNWVDLAGSGASTNEVLAIDPKNASVFFRLRSP